ncbi:hypothetical protein EWM64_g2090 [Hericium alpestre]|uniref:Uncharacterized protein n=1 Tax=Hericium alpestre TaxID=135208 RepID=A0A4Z0A4H6_9AGAM|nr:hypothetical protein EWM64_g2090 [Hericium alpestre]
MQRDTKLKDALPVADIHSLLALVAAHRSTEDPGSKKRVREDEVGGEGEDKGPSKKRAMNDTDGKQVEAEELEHIDKEVENSTNEDGEEYGDEHDEDDSWDDDEEATLDDVMVPGHPIYEELARDEAKQLANDNARRLKMTTQRRELKTPSKACRDCGEVIYEDQGSQFVNRQCDECETDVMIKRMRRR